ncbi:hypothetical protein C8R45DRAFT_109396 [Mycena sanguinolenta]|nr:hypothetical protein C8R45DRAFT_109396 [Mycena sanguinolenta]
MAKRQRHSEEYESSDDHPESNSDSDDYSPAKTAKGKKKAKKTPTPSTKAEVTIRATDTPLDRVDSQKRLEKVDGAILGRIKKALALASHEQTGEDEARAALRMASKLLERHNVTQAEVMAHETESEQLKRAGTSIVSIKSTVSPTTTVNIERWTNTLAHAMETFFDCQSYNTRFNGHRPKVDWAFYGLAEQTVTAAAAFEMCYNLISAWSLTNAGKGVHAKSCYRSGVAQGLSSMAHKEKEEDKRRAVKKEQALLKARQEEETAENKARLDRLEAPEDEEAKIKADEVQSEPDRRVKMEEVDDDDDFGGPRAFDNADWGGKSEAASQRDDTELFEDFDDVAPHFNDEDNADDLLDLDAEKPVVKRSDSVGPSMGPPASVPSPPAKEEPEDDSPWSSVGQLVAFREQSKAIGDDYLKSQGVKLVKGRKQKALEFKDSEARRIYNKGKKDAESIDVRQKRVKDVGMD